MNSQQDGLNIAVVHDGGLMIGGGRVWLTEICRGLKLKGHKPLVLVSTEYPIPPLFDYQKVPYPDVGLVPERIKVMASIPLLVEKLRLFGPDVTIFETRQWRAKILERILRVPAAIYYHTVPVRSHLISSIDGLLARNVKLVMTNSFYLKKRIKELYGLEEVEVVYPGVDAERYKPGNEPNGYMLHISRLVPGKNHKFLAHVLRHCKLAKRLVIAGPCSDWRYLEYLKSISPSTVTYRPNISEDEKVTLLRNCSFFLHPPVSWEAFGLAVLEAMACGKPVIASSNSLALRETVGRGGGLLCPPVLSEWVRTIEILSSDQKLVDRLGKQARKIALRFSWSNTVEKLERNIAMLVKTGI